MNGPGSTMRVDWIMTVLSAVFLAGLFLDGWAHTHGRVDNTFFTPWHAVLYSGWAACGLFLAGTALRNIARGSRWRQALPPGYGLSLAGAALWLVAGPGDAVWHAIFGFEANVEALLSPAHLVLVLGAALVLTGPLRSGWARADAELDDWRRSLPMLLSMTFVLSQMTFFTQIGHPIANVWGRGAALPRLSFVAEEMGILGILVETTLLMGGLLLLLRRGVLPAASVTVMFGLNALAMGFLYEEAYPVAQVIAFALAGAAADLLRRLLKPTLDRAVALRVYAFAVPALLHLGYFGSLKLTEGLWWSVHLWVGAAMFSGVLGWLLSYLVLAPGTAMPEASTADRDGTVVTLRGQLETHAAASSDRPVSRPAATTASM